MEWNVNTVDVHPKEEGRDDVIYNVHWSVSKEDGEYSARSYGCLLYTSPSPRDRTRSRMPSSA